MFQVDGFGADFGDASAVDLVAFVQTQGVAGAGDEEGFASGGPDGDASEAGTRG